MKFFSNAGQMIFWAGFLAGTIFWWLAFKFSPTLKTLGKDLLKGFQQFRESLRVDPRLHYFNDLIVLYQSRHLAGAYFSLDEIIVPPRLLAPHARVDPDRDIHPTHSVHQAIPSLLEWPEIYSTFGAPTISLGDSVRSGARVLIVGRAGTGKTTAMIHLALQIARHAPEIAFLHPYTPILLHLAEIDFSRVTDRDLLSPLVNSLSRQVSGKSQKRIPELIRHAFTHQAALLMVDGLDEASNSQVSSFREYLSRIIKHYPGNRYILAASPEFSDGLPGLEFTTVSMATWTQHVKQQFIHRWQDLWSQHLSDKVWGENKATPDDFYPLVNWLVSDRSAQTPLEITLKTWAVFAGDAQGLSNRQALGACLIRMINRNSNTQAGLERMCLRMLLEQQPCPSESDARSWFSNKPEIPRSADGELVNLETCSLPDAANRRKQGIRSQGFNDALASGFLVRRGNNSIALVHPIFAGYLAGNGLALFGGSAAVFAQDPWWLRTLALQYMAASVDITPICELAIAKDNLITQNLLSMSRWLPEGAEKSPWKIGIMRKLVGVMQGEAYSFAQRTRAMAGLANSGDPAIPGFFRKLVQENDPVTRQLAILGLGYLRDEVSTETITKSVMDPTPQVGWSACMALAAIGTIKALEGIASGLLHGNEALQRAAAEALSTHPKEGHEILKEAAEVEEFLVRRASVFGLAMIPEYWATEILTHLMLDDPQWVVKNAASHALDTIQNGSPFVPYPLTELHQTPWLLLFAGEQGQGITPGKVAREILHQAARQGKPEQRLAALGLLQYYALEDSIPILYEVFLHNTGEIRDEAHQVLLAVSAMGIRLPDPMKFGM